MDNNFYAVSVVWSQTDIESFLVIAKNKKDAERKIKAGLSGYRWINGITKLTYTLIGY